MEIRIMGIVLFILLLLGVKALEAQTPAFTLMGIGAQPVPVTVNKMTNLVFPVAIRTGIKVSREVLVQKVKGVDNVIEIKAVHPNFKPTNLSVYGMDGQLYSFDLEYADSPGVLNYRVVNTSSLLDSPSPGDFHPVLLTGLPADETTLNADAKLLSKKRGFLHKTVAGERMGLSLTGIYLKDSLLWFTVHVRNRSLIGYRPEYVRVGITDKKKVKRTAVQERAIVPLIWNLPGEIKGSSTESFAMGFAPFTIARDKKLVIEMAEQGGGRTLTLEIKSKVLLKARAVR